MFVLLQDRQQQVKHLMPIKTYIAECLDKIQGVIRGMYHLSLLWFRRSQFCCIHYFIVLYCFMLWCILH
jgi:hypothetical protein